MKFFAVHIDDLESERFVSASNDQVANWLFGHALCSKQQNGGTISNAAALPPRFWSRHGIDHDVILAPSPLWSWVGDDLTFSPYDIAGQTVFERKVAGGKTRAKQRWAGTPEGTPDRTPISTPTSTPDADKSTIHKKKSARFVPPSVADIMEYGSGLNPPFRQAEKLHAYYESNGWKVGRNPMKDWKATVRKWNADSAQNQPTARPGTIIVNGKTYEQ